TWSGVPTVTASIRSASWSSILRKSLYFRAFGNALNVPPALWSSTSHRATMLAPSRLTVAMSPPPMPPAPIPATLTRSLGATKPAPPRTWRGTMAKLQANPAVMPRKTRRESSMGQGAPSVVCIAFLLREGQGDPKEAPVPEPTEPRRSGSGSAGGTGRSLTVAVWLRGPARRDPVHRLDDQSRQVRVAQRVVFVRAEVAVAQDRV